MHDRTSKIDAVTSRKMAIFKYHRNITYTKLLFFLYFSDGRSGGYKGRVKIVHGLSTDRFKKADTIR